MYNIENLKKIFSSNREYTLRELKHLFGINEETLLSDLKKLEQCGIIMMQGNNYKLLDENNYAIGKLKIYEDNGAFLYRKRAL